MSAFVQGCSEQVKWEKSAEEDDEKDRIERMHLCCSFVILNYTPFVWWNWTSAKYLLHSLEIRKRWERGMLQSPDSAGRSTTTTRASTVMQLLRPRRCFADRLSAQLVDKEELATAAVAVSRRKLLRITRFGILR